MTRQHKFFQDIKELRSFLILWLTQAFSSLGSGMTNFALLIWSFRAEGSALSTALLSVASYGPYVLMSIFAGALSDRWNKKTVMLWCDAFAALCTCTVFFLLESGQLRIWHLYILNAVNGLMNTVQQPAAEVATTLLTPRKFDQRIGGLRALSNAVNNILTPMLASALMGLLGLRSVLVFDLTTFAVAFIVLLTLIRLPRPEAPKAQHEPLRTSARQGLDFLRRKKGVLHIILFLSAINLTASMYNAALPAMLLSRNGGSDSAMGILSSVSGIAMLVGGLLASTLPKPRSRVRMVCNTLLLSMGTENFFLAFGRSLPVWCVGSALGWIGIPLMNASLDAIMRGSIPVAMQGRTYAVRNTLQFFTIPVGYLLGGALVDSVFEPLMARQDPNSLLAIVFGTGKGTGAALLFLLLGFLGLATCLIFRRDSAIWQLDAELDSSLKASP